MSSRSTTVALWLCIVFGTTIFHVNTTCAEVDFCMNSGFEDDTQNPELPYQYGQNTAYPWAYWRNGGVPTPGAPQAAVPNPDPGTSNVSPRVWANFNNPDYVNVASHYFDLVQPATGFWVVPSATYHVSSQFYVPTSEVLSGITPRAGIVLTMAHSNPPGQPTYVQPLTRDYYENPYVDPLVPVVNPVSPDILPLDEWVTKEFDWNFDQLYPQRVLYSAFRIYGGDGQFIGGPDGAPNPGGYFDNCQISSDDYRDDLHGYVRDLAGNPIAGATVTLRSPFFDYDSMNPEMAARKMDVSTTAADGSYELPTWAPHGYEFRVDAILGEFASTGEQTLMVTANNSQFPDITIVPEPSTAMLLFASLALLPICRRRGN